MKEYKFEKDKISLFECENKKQIDFAIKKIFKDNEKILPKNKKAKILIKPNLNNDLNALTGNSTDLRIIIPVLGELKKRGYKNIILADGPNCGINHIGIDVFSRLCLNKVAKMFNVKLMNLNHDAGKKEKLITGNAELAKTCLDADFIINLPKMKTHMEAGMTLSCKNYMGCIKGVGKRKMHENLSENIVRLNEIIKTDLIIVDGLIGMEGNGPGDGIPKKVGIVLSGHNPYLVDFLSSRLMGLNYKKILFLNIALKKGYLTKDDEKIVRGIEKIADFIPAKQNLFSRILLYKNIFMNIRFSRPFERFFNRGFIPWLLFKLKVRQDVYVHKERDIKRLYEKPKASEIEKKKVRRCLEVYCPLGHKRLGSKDCIKCMYCYQILPDLVEVEGDLGAFKMQMERFGRFRENG